MNEEFYISVFFPLLMSHCSSGSPEDRLLDFGGGYRIAGHHHFLSTCSLDNFLHSFSEFLIPWYLLSLKDKGHMLSPLERVIWLVISVFTVGKCMVLLAHAGSQRTFREQKCMSRHRPLPVLNLNQMTFKVSELISNDSQRSDNCISP